MSENVITIRVGDEECPETILPYDSEAVPGADGLIAVTRASEGSGWTVTHVGTGRCFVPVHFMLLDDALVAAKNLFDRYPTSQLRETDMKAVTKGFSKKQVFKMMAGA